MGDECEFGSESYYTAISPNDIELREGWNSFESNLKTSTRFFNPAARSMLASVFEGIIDYETHDNQRVVIDAGPNFSIHTLFRARAFQSEALLEEALKRPDIGLGPPPFHAATAGRMNAHGISMFCGALDESAALAEIRPPVGCRAGVGTFKITRPIKLLDVEALKSVLIKGSIFDSGWINQLEKAKFLGRLSRRITMPVMPNDEPYEYLITQAIADYLATEVELDGIIYPSAQADGKSRKIVLFNHAARVGFLDLPPATKISVSTRHHSDDESETDYWVFEETPYPSEPKSEANEGALLFSQEMPLGEERDGRPVTLQLDDSSVCIHHVTSVAIGSERYFVHRTRSVRIDPPF